MISVEEMSKVEKCFWCKSNKFKRVAERKDGVGINECKNCGLLLVAEMPDDLSEYYDKESYFNPHGETETGYHENYDLLPPFFLYWQGALIEEISRRGNKGSLLEVGCATGNALEMVQLFNKDISLYGIDLSSYAIKICKEKGLSASVSKINGFKAKKKFDIVLSSETMEHVDELREFVEGVKENLSKNGMYVFYVPAVDREVLIKQSRDYPSLTTSLEHVSYFTKPFLQNALSEAFKASVYIHQISAGGDNYHLGFVSSDKTLVSNMEKFTKAFEHYDNSLEDANTLHNLITIAAKFSNFDTSEKYLRKLEDKKVSSKNLDFLRGLISFSKGDLIKSKEYFTNYLGGTLPSNFIIKVLLSVEREWNKLLSNELETLKKHNEQLEARIAVAEEELRDLKQSKIVGNAIKLRHIVGATLNPFRRFKKKIKPRLFKIAVRLVPRRLRRPIKYLVTLQWRTKHIKVENRKIPTNQPLVSVVIPYYNRASTIDETIKSLQSQTFKNFEVLLVNDGSTDPMSTDKLEKLDLKNLKAEIINQPNQGVAVARNHGISKARGKYIICLDSDDFIDDTYIEKCLLTLESNPNVDLATTDTRFFGVNSMIYRQSAYNPLHLIDNNMVTTAAMFDIKGWQKVGGYKADIGYEDWEFWVNLAENGYWGVNIPEVLFNYRTALSSRYIEDLASHKENMKKIRDLHPKYSRKIKKFQKYKKFNHKYISSDSLFANLDSPKLYERFNNSNKNILIAIPWMTFGGAETLILNFCHEIKDNFNLSFITGLESKHEWEHKFKHISPNIYHMANLFEDVDLYVEFVSNYIKTRQIDLLHIIHTGYVFEMLDELRKRHRDLKVVVTMFNDRAAHFQESLRVTKYINTFITDNEAVYRHYRQELGEAVDIKVIPNGINSTNVFNPLRYDPTRERQALDINKGELSVFFIGRLSEEKNPDVFLRVAKNVVADKKISNIKFFVIGDGPMTNEVKKLVGSINNKSVQYLGYQSDIARYLSAADIFILPSSIEGFPLSILEAMAMRVAVVASDVGAVAEVIESGSSGFVVSPGSEAEIAEAIINLSKDPQLLADMKAKAREKIEKKYSNTILGKNYKKLYDELIK